MEQIDYDAYYAAVEWELTRIMGEGGQPEKCKPDTKCGYDRECPCKRVVEHYMFYRKNQYDEPVCLVVGTPFCKNSCIMRKAPTGCFCLF